MHNEGCEDPTWHDCYFYGTGCETQPEDGFESGFEAGYLDGYADGLRDTLGPEPEEMDDFQLRLVTAAFDDWVKEEVPRSGRFHCGLDIRVDFPFDDTEYMALWAANTCSDWDLYLTIVADDDTGKHALAYAGAELSKRRGCYETMQEDVGACEFYMPHGGDNFGVLFSGGFHAIWHEHEWEYNP